MSVLCTIVCTFMGPKRRIETVILHTYYISLYIYLYLNILCLLTGDTRPKYWSRFSGAQCQNGNNANSIIIILIGAQTEAGVSRIEYYIIYMYVCVSGKMAQGSVCRNVNSFVRNTNHTIWYIQVNFTRNFSMIEE